MKSKCCNYPIRVSSNDIKETNYYICNKCDKACDPIKDEPNNNINMEKEMTPQNILEKNFNGLDELIKDKDLLLFYKDLIVTCIEEYHNNKSENRIEELKQALSGVGGTITKLKEENQELLNEQGELFTKIANLELAMQEFVDRVDKGEVRSTYTYNKFKKLLK